MYLKLITFVATIILYFINKILGKLPLMSEVKSSSESQIIAI